MTAGSAAVYAAPSGGQRSRKTSSRPRKRGPKRRVGTQSADSRCGPADGPATRHCHASSFSEIHRDRPLQLEHSRPIAGDIAEVLAIGGDERTGSIDVFDQRFCRVPRRACPICKTPYTRAMELRLPASLVALVVLVSGTVPVVGGYHCISMGTRMQAPSACCNHEPTESTIKAPCCEWYAPQQIDRRTTPVSHKPVVQVPIAVAWNVLPTIAPTQACFDLQTPRRARGRPPDEQLLIFGTVLRV